MILDGLLLFDTAALVNTVRASTNVIDLLNARDIGVGDNPAMKVMVVVTTSFTTTNSATLMIQAQGSTDNTTYTTYAESRAYAAADLVAGNPLGNIDWPVIGPADPLPRYLRLNYVTGPNVGTSAFGTGTVSGAITAALVLDRQNFRAYPPGLAISN